MQRPRSLVLPQVQFIQGCRHGCYHATNRPCGSGGTVYLGGPSAAVHYSGTAGDRTDRLGPRVIRSRQSFEYRGRLEEDAGPVRVSPMVFTRWPPGKSECCV